MTGAKTKTINQIGLFVLLAMIITACGSGAEESTETTTGDSPATTAAESPDTTAGGGEEGGVLDVWMAEGAGQQEIDLQIEAAEQFEEATGWTVEYRRIPFSEYDSSLLTALAAGEGPDVALINSVTFGAFASRGDLAPTDDLIAASDELSVDDFFEGLYRHGEHDGAHYGLPLDTGTRMLFYNRDIFDAAGIEPPTTYEEMASVAEQLTDEEAGVFGFAEWMGDHWGVLYESVGMWANSQQLPITESDGVSCAADGANVAQNIEFWASLYQSGATNSDAPTANNEVATQLFNSGRVAMTMNGFWGADVFTDVDYGVVALQGSESGQAGSTTGGWVISITKDAEDPTVAFQFIESVLSPENITKFTNLFPATHAGAEVALPDEFYDPFKELLEVAQHPIPITATLPERAQALQSAVQQAMNEAMTPEDAAAQFCEQSASLGR